MEQRLIPAPSSRLAFSRILIYGTHAMIRIVLLDDDFFAVSFPYNAALVERIKRLTSRRWNPDARQWEVHLTHLPDVMVMLRLNQAMLPPNVRKAYADRWQGLDAVIRVSNDYTVISGGKIPVDALDEEVSYWRMNAEHTTSYKEGKWDGMRRLFDRRSSSFPTGLISRIIKVLDRQQVRYRVDDLRERGTETLRFKRPPMSQLRAYQKEALDAAIKGERGVLEMATGSGKTVVAAYIIGKLKRPALFFVHTRDLLYQTRNLLERILGIPIGQIGDGVVDIKDVTVGTIQTCSRALGLAQAKSSDDDTEDSEVEQNSSNEEPELLPEKVEQINELLRNVPVAVFDECHHIPAETSYLLALNLPKAMFRFGLSATPYRSDRQDMLIEAALGERLVSINASYLIERKHLVPPHITFFVMQASEGNQGRTYHEVYQREIVENEKRNQFAADIARKYLAENKTVLVLVGQIKHGKRLAALLPEAIFLTGRDSSSVRNEALDRLRDRTQPLIIATTLADEGLDIPSLDVLILAGGGRSETRALQRIGRALRPVKGKSKAYVVDFFDEARFLCEHSKSRIEIYETERYFQMEMINPWTGKNLSLEEFTEGSSQKPQQGTLLPDPPKKRRAKRPQPSL